jgi:acetyl esterase/lipase
MLYEIIHLAKRFPQLAENGCDPKLTVYLPDNMTDMGRGNQKRPCLLVCPGGGYRGVSQREGEPIGLHFLPRGYNVFVLWYSVSPHRFPTQLREVAAAMEVIYENAEMWHCDTQKIAIMGFSAGGHLAAHYTNAYNWQEVREMFPESKPVNASVLCYPVITADPRHAHLGSFRNLLGKEELTADEQLRFSCDKLVTAQTPPTFLWHTRQDQMVPVMNTLLYGQALAEHSVPFAIHIYPEGVHGLATVDSVTNNELSPAAMQAKDWLNAVHKWLSFTF